MRIPARAGISVTSIVGSLALAVTLGVGGASAAPTDGPGGSGNGNGSTPSQAQVDQARADVRRTAHGVAAIKAELGSAQEALDAATVQAQIAAEKFNGARWRLGLARKALTRAIAKADRAEQDVADQRAGIARLAVQSFRGGTQADTLSLLVDQQDASQVLGSYGALHSASSSMDATYERYRDSLTRAKVAKVEATSARTRAAELLTTARRARSEAAAAQAAAGARTAGLQARTADLTRQLARAQGISMQLAQARAHALRVAAERAAAAKAARIAAAKAAAAERARQEAAAAQAARDRAAQDKASSHASSGSGGSSSSSSSESSSSPAPAAPAPAAPAAPDAPRASSGGVAAAIAFAKAQIGDPYVWGAAGPSSWDCSGLMMGAWQAGGVSLPHYSVAQYASITHISRDQLQPGDLVFWGSSPGSIYHVAMYLGGGQLIEAPRTGLDVRIESIDDWIPPTYFGRP